MIASVNNVDIIAVFSWFQRKCKIRKELYKEYLLKMKNHRTTESQDRRKHKHSACPTVGCETQFIKEDSCLPNSGLWISSNSLIYVSAC